MLNNGKFMYSKFKRNYLKIFKFFLNAFFDQKYIDASNLILTYFYKINSYKINKTAFFFYRQQAYRFSTIN